MEANAAEKTMPAWYRDTRLGSQFSEFKSLIEQTDGIPRSKALLPRLEALQAEANEIGGHCWIRKMVDEGVYRTQLEAKLAAKPEKLEAIPASSR